MIRGIDVSHYQGAVNWPALAAAHNLQFGAAKASEGTSFVDPLFARNWAHLKAAGMTRIAYHYANVNVSVTKQVDLLLKLADPAPGDVLCLDLEKGGGTKAQALQHAFGDQLAKKAPGVTRVLYLGSGYAGTTGGRDAAEHWDYWWFPRYDGSLSRWPATYAPHLTGGNVTGWAHPHLWQWSNNLAGKDANVSILTVAELRGTKAPDPKPKPTDPGVIAVGIWNTKIKFGKSDSTAAAYLVHGKQAAADSRDNTVKILTELAAIRTELDAVKKKVGA